MYLFIYGIFVRMWCVCVCYSRKSFNCFYAPVICHAGAASLRRLRVSRVAEWIMNVIRAARACSVCVPCVSYIYERTRHRRSASHLFQLELVWLVVGYPLVAHFPRCHPEMHNTWMAQTQACIPKCYNVCAIMLCVCLYVGVRDTTF